MPSSEKEPLRLRKNRRVGRLVSSKGTLAMVLALLILIDTLMINIKVEGFSFGNSISTRPFLGNQKTNNPLVLWSTSSEGEEDDNEWEVASSPPTNAADSGDLTEKAWRYVKRPLLSIGAKGASPSHGNSLRQLLEAHTAVKVKVNVKPFDGSLDTAFETLRELAEQSGAPQGMELLQAREGENTILLGMPGTLQKLEQGTFPPPPSPPREEKEEA